MPYIKNSKEYSNYLRGKRVIVCGPGDILYGKNLGAKINNYEVVVRLNNSYPVNTINYLNNIEVGKRTDVLYHTGAINTCLKIAANKSGLGRIELLRKDGLKWFVSKRDPINGSDRDKMFISKFVNLNNKYNNKYNITDKIKVVPVFNFFLGDLQQILLKTDPNMSTMAIVHLLTFDIKSLEIVGCDFYSGGYHRYYTLPSHMKWSNISQKLVRKDGKKRRKANIPHDYSTQISFLLDIFKNDGRVKIEKDILNKWKKHLK